MSHLVHHTEATSPKRVVVLGASGFIGRLLARSLSARGVDVAAPDSSLLDLTAPDSGENLSRLLRPDDHLVFLSAVTPDKGRDLASFARNMMMGEQVCQALLSASCAHLTYVSSDSVFRDPAEQVTEAAWPSPLELYGVAHHARERMLAHTCVQTELPFLVVRPVAVYGALDSHNSYGPTRFLRQALSTAEIEIFGEGEEQRDHIFVHDLVNLLVQLIYLRSTGTLHAATGVSLSFAGLALKVGEIVGEASLKHLPRRQPITHRTFDIRTLRAALPSFEFTPLAEGLRQTYSELKESSTIVR